MTDPLSIPATAFQAGRRLAAGPLRDVAQAVKAAFDRDPTATALTFDDRTGAQLDFDLSGTADEFVARLTARANYEAYLAERKREQQEAVSAPPVGGRSSSPSSAPASGAEDVARTRGRPKLGVVSREVTLLPRHWEWLAAQPGTASQVLRRLVDEARRADGGANRARVAREHAYAFISAIGGNLPGFEEATRALFAGDRAKFERETAGWSDDVRDYAVRLAWGPA